MHQKKIKVLFLLTQFLIYYLRIILNYSSKSKKEIFLSNFSKNDINLNSDNTGILLYGINGVGKSSLSKAIGLNIILTQIGYYVAASYFELMPYKKLFTRINCDDNLFKGQSSFIVEMLELRS